MVENIDRMRTVADSARLSEAVESGRAVAVYGDGEPKWKMISVLRAIAQRTVSLAVSKNRWWQDNGMTRTEAVGPPSYAAIERMGMLPDILVVETGTEKEALEAAEWTVLGVGVVCFMGAPSSSGKADSIVFDFAEGSRFCLPASVCGNPVASNRQRAEGRSWYRRNIFTRPVPGKKAEARIRL
jgi:hypothetical protein